MSQLSRTNDGGRHMLRGVLAVCVGLALGGCETVEAKNGQASPGKSANAKGNGKKGSAPERPPAPVAVTAAKTGEIASHYVTTATLEAEKTARILARVKGVVRSIAKEEGDDVKKGDLLLSIERNEYQLLVDQAKTRAQSLRDQFERLKGLVKKDLAPVEEFDRVKHDLAAADTEVQLARLNLSRTRVRAPFAGRLVSRSIDLGEMAADGTEVFSIADMDPLLARVFVPSREFKKLAREQPVELSIAGSKTRLTGKIKLVSPVIDPATGTIKVTLEIPTYPSGTRPGDFAEVRIVTERHENAVLVPRVAVVEDRAERIVFVSNGATVTRRIVSVGFTNDAHAEILNGISEGESVVTKGQHSLDDGAKIKILGDG